MGREKSKQILVRLTITNVRAGFDENFVYEKFEYETFKHYSAYQEFGQAELDYRGLVLGSSQFLLMP